MKILPIALTPKKVLLIGAGRAAAIKAVGILESGSSLVVIAEERSDPLFNVFQVTIKSFELEDAAGYDLVVNATGNRKLSKLLWKERKRLGCLLNCVDAPEYCDFFFNAVYRDGDYSISVSSGGVNPTGAQQVRDFIKGVLPPLPFRAEKGKVYLIGAGPCSIDNLSLKGLKVIASLDAALIDLMVGEDIRSLLPKKCIKLDAGKKAGSHLFPQEKINRILLECAEQGLAVGRLKGGDPAIFGRLHEEASYLLEKGIEIEIIPGVSSVTAGLLAAGIIPTIRGVSSSLTVASAHLKDNVYNDVWLEQVKCGGTFVILMAHSFADKITQSAVKYGVAADTPAAFISKVDTPDQKAVFGSIGELERMAKECERPALLVIGNVAGRENIIMN
ncbi:MAG: uroporphyrinogen-III C-methyltransferase [Deferribacteraceae bacterium]|jgi:uroporphyrin-III C-methyltransferase/precorrin-2 dehydrogenase/sirohydrochlorin ferrochelatase|nr:uroporphyrinogen-III C-methyltransferase [Deferribacteraceae bacterium]